VDSQRQIQPQARAVCKGYRGHDPQQQIGKGNWLLGTSDKIAEHCREKKELKNLEFRSDRLREGMKMLHDR